MVADRAGAGGCYSAEMGTTVVQPASRILGRLRIPGDKSVSHRYALLAAISEGPSIITNYAPGTDCTSTLSCLGALGVAVDRPPDGPDRDLVTIEGCGINGLRAPQGPLDAGNSGTTVRLLAGILAGQKVTSTLVGDASLSRRPMGRIIEPLTRLGARLEGTDGRLPLTVTGGPLTGIDYAPPVASAQVKSAVLLAGLQARGRTTVRELQLTRDHTERALPMFGIQLSMNGSEISLEGGQRPIGAELSVPGDASSAACWAVAAAALPGSEISLEAVGLNPGRIGFLAALERAGAAISVEDRTDAGGEPRGTIIVRHGTVSPFEIAPDEVPSVIDELPILAALATHGGRLRVTGAGELRHKESDRIAALATGLRALGGQIDELEDGFEVDGSKPLTGGQADAAGDHRLAMAFALAALGAGAPSEISNAEAVDISYPGFFHILRNLSQT